MPSKSKKQHDLMNAACHNKDFAKKADVPQKVACEFSKADKKSGKTFVENIIDDNAVGNVTMDIALMVRLLELCREDIKSDVDLHFLVENIMSEMSKVDVLTMDNYENIVSSLPSDVNLEETVYNKKSSILLSNAIRAIADEPNADNRKNVLMKFADDHGVSFNDLYNPILAELGPKYFKSENKLLDHIKKHNKF